MNEYLEIIEIVNKLNEKYSEDKGEECFDLPFSFNYFGYNYSIKFWSEVVYKSWDDERRIYESLEEYLIREANTITKERFYIF